MASGERGKSTVVSAVGVTSLLLALLCLFPVAPALSDGPRVSEGELLGPVSLSGDWKFQPGDDPRWASPDFDDRQWMNAPLPGRWPAGGYPESGQFAWYRLTLVLDKYRDGQPASDFELALRTGKVMSAFEVYAGGERVGGVGKLPPLAEINYDRMKVLPIPRAAIGADGTLVLALRVWGGPLASVSVWGGGPYEGGFTLGNYADLLLSGIAAQIPGLLACVLFIGFGIYHLYLYRRNRQLDTYLWFGLMAINIGIYGLMLNQWKYAVDLSFVAYKKIEFGAIYLFPALVIQMLWTLLDKPVHPMLRAYQLSFVAAAIMVVAIPGLDIHAATLGYFQLWSLPLVVMAPWLMVSQLRAGHPEARTLFLGVMIFFATCVNDLLIDLARVDTTRLMPYGFVAIMLAMAVSLANRFTANMSRLEEEVEERTRELSAANDRLAEAARVDPLTGLFNRRGFIEEAEVEIQRVFRGGKPFAVMLADIDNFKKFNDRHGHACGDHVLARVAAMLRERVRDVDRIARWGGEEFILLLPETNADGAANLASKLRQAIADNVFEYEGRRLTITLTLGVAAYRKGDSLDACIARADRALYLGKEEGRNTVAVSDSGGLSLVN